MENLSPGGSGHSEELKPSCPERKEHMDFDDGQIVDESINPFQSDENSNILVTKNSTEGNMVVKPEPMQKEDKDDFQEPEVSSKSKMKSEIAFGNFQIASNVVSQLEPRQKKDKDDFQEPEVSNKSKMKTETAFGNFQIACDVVVQLEPMQKKDKDDFQEPEVSNKSKMKTETAFGNVVVQSEPRQKEDKDDFQEPEVNNKNKMKTETAFGNVVVQPEPKQKEDKDDFQELGVSDKSKMKTEFSKRYVGESLYETVNCTACGQHVNHYKKDSVYRHPALNVLICKSCYVYMSDDMRHDSKRTDKLCRWCAEDGDLIFCDSCHDAFCKKCIRRNLGRKEILKIMDENTDWNCYICQPEPLLDLIAICDSIFENLSHLKQQYKKKKLVSEKSDKACDHPEKFKYGSCAEGTHQVYDSSSDTAACPFSTLLIPIDLIKRTKILVENVREINATFLKVLEQLSSNSEVSPSERLSQYETIRYMMTGLGNAQEALEECLNNEVISLVVREMEENTKERQKENV
ncbi:transcriptional regulator ATRX-like isoform X2 [Sminthopsis crassicaudata]|uniref:transcriptional regulator ATRX-like isoform X2 n=1 Tax=Sminthopsis crassicaudata TaxID=9301 RepID=UPI003D684E86